MPSRQLKWAIILCKFNDKPAETQPREYYEDLFTANGTGGMCDYWSAVTHNHLDLSGSEVFGWFTMNHASTEVAGLTFPGQRSVLVQWGRDTAIANGVNLNLFHLLLVVQNYGVDHGAAGNGILIVHQNPALCEYGFIGHEMGHGHGLPHSFSANPDVEYGDPWDLMSFALTYRFNLGFRGLNGEATVGLNARNLEQLGGLPFRRTWSAPGPDFSEQVLLQPLNQPALGQLGPLVAKLPPGSTRPARPNGSTYTVEFRRRAGWDRAIPQDAVIVHEVRSNGQSYLPSSGLNLVAGGQFVTPDPKVFIAVTAIDAARETATVRIWDMPDGCMRKEDSNPNAYWITNGYKRLVSSPQVLAALGKTWADVKSIPDGGLTAIPGDVLRVGVAPYPVPLGRAVSVTFTAAGAAGHAIAGSVKVNGAAAGGTNTAFTYTFRARRRRIGPRDWEVTPPAVTVDAPGFPETVVDCGFVTP